MKYLATVTLFLIAVTFTFAQESKQAVKPTKDIKAPLGTEATNAVLYDFTTGSNKYYGGTDAAVDLGGGVWGMIAGDANQSSIITNADVDPINTDLNNSGYYNSDINMSGIVTNADVDFINSNLNKSSQVPD